MKRKHQALSDSAPIFEELEPRLLFSADGADAIATPVLEQDLHEEPIVMAEVEAVDTTAVIAAEQPEEQDANIPVPADNPVQNNTILEENTPDNQQTEDNQGSGLQIADQDEAEISVQENADSDSKPMDQQQGTGVTSPAPEENDEQTIFSAALSPENTDTASIASDCPAIGSESELAPTEPGINAAISADAEEENEINGSTGNVVSNELALVNDNVEDYQQIVDDLQQQDDGNRDIEVVVLDHHLDGTDQVTEILQDRTNLDTIHIISHGRDGGLALGNEWLDNDSLTANSEDVRSWGNALNTDGDILLYGCNIAADSSGQGFVDTLAELTDADIAASDDSTGSAARDGDWDLEYSIGTIDSTTAVDQSLQSEYQGLLATAVDTVDVTTDDTGATSITLSHTTSGTNRLIHEK